MFFLVVLFSHGAFAETTATQPSPSESQNSKALVPTDRLVALPPMTASEKKKNGNGAESEAKIGQPSPTPVRLPYLPSRFISAAPIAPPKRPRETPEPKAGQPTPLPTPTPTMKAGVTPTPSPTPALDQEAFAAFAAFKKRQLDALESDRQTLAALQAAIADLGLQEKLMFLNEQTDISDLKSEMKTYPKIITPTPAAPQPSPSASAAALPTGEATPAPTAAPSPVPAASPTANYSSEVETKNP